MNTRINYRGKTVNIGIDVHKKDYKIAALLEGEPVKRWTCDANPAELVASLKRFFKGALLRSVYEAGFSGFGLHRALEAAGINSIVVNAASIAVAANDRVKTDKRDALKLAKLLETSSLKAIHVPTAEQELRRLLQRTRDQLVKLRTAIGNRIKAKLYQFGLIDCESRRVMSPAYLKDIENLSLPKELKFVLGELISQWRNLSSSIDRLDKAMKEQAREEPEREAILQSVPGVGDVTSRILSTELVNIERFKSAKDLFSYTGLTPSEFSSGTKVRHGHISRQGPGRLRSILVEASWRAIDDSPELRQIYERIKARRGGNMAIVAVARHLVGRVRACLMKGCLYQEQDSASLAS